MYIGIDYLKEGMIVNETVFLGKAALISSGMVLTEQLIERLKKHKDLLEHNTLKVSITNLPIQKQQEIRKEIEWNQNSVETTIDINIKNEIKETLKSTIQSNSKPIELVQKCATTITNSLYWNQFKIINEKTKEKAWVPNLEYDLEDYEEQNDIYEHSLRVSQFAVVVAAAYNLKQAQLGNKKETINLEKIATAALLHDYGLRYQDPNAMKTLSKYKLSNHLIESYNIDSDILTKPYDEKNSPIYSFISLPLDNTITNMILYSKENDMKNGPLKASKDDINTSNNIKMASRIINLCNLYDDILKQAINNGINGQNMNLENVSAVMDFAATNGLIDKELMDIFYENIPLYSIGTRVQLSDNRYARVIKRTTNKQLSSKPTVITTDGEIVDLSKAPLNLTIKRIVTKNEKLSNLVNNMALEQITGITNDCINEEETSIIKK